MIKATVWLSAEDHALLSRLLVALNERDQANGLHMAHGVRQLLLLSQAVTEGLQVIAERTLPRSGAPVDAVTLAKSLQALFACTEAVGAAPDVAR